MRRVLILILTVCTVHVYAQDHHLSPRQAVYLTTPGRTSFVLSYDYYIASEFSLQGGMGLNNFDRTASTAFRIGVNYLRGRDHFVEFSLAVDIWTKLFNPIAPEDQFLSFIAGYRYQPESGFMFRVGLDILRLDERFIDFGERVQNVLQVSVGYGF